MTGLVAVRRAPPLDSYPAILYRGEGVTAMLRVEPCACGGSVVQWRDETVTKAVQGHNASPQHRAWRVRT
jgi:hypothetical protein